MSRIPTVLIVEDDPVFRRVMGFTVARCGLQVETAADGCVAYDRLCRGGISFLVTDLQMPVCTGLELIDRLDANADIERPPTILCTAKGLELDAVEVIRQKNLLAIMHKPFSPRKLGEMILREIENGAAEPNTNPSSLSVTDGVNAESRVPTPSALSPVVPTGRQVDPLELSTEGTIDD